MARQSLVEFFPEYARQGNDTAFIFHRRYRTQRWTYRQIAADARRFARELEARGIGKGDAVVLRAENSPEWAVVFWGCVLRGAVVVPIDQISTAEFSLRVAQQVNAKLLVHSQEVPTPDLAIPRLGIVSVSETIAPHSDAAYPSPQLSRQDVLEIVFTSGTTSEPRGVVITHGNVLANIEPLEGEIKKYLRYERIFHPLRFLNLLPLSHIFGQLLALFIPPMLGAGTIFLDSLRPSESLETIRRERVSVLIAVPRVIESLEREIEQRFEGEGRIEQFRKDIVASEKEHFFLRWWRFRRIHRRLGWKFWAFISGGAALPAATESFWNRLGYAVIQGYGLTETTSLISLNHPFRSDKGSIGKLFPGLEMIVDPNGEILVRGENVAAGYWSGRQLQPAVGEDGWFHTGDLAEVDEQGRLFFKGRQKNVIVTPAGMNIYPQDLERALREQAGVKESVVIGLERDGNAEPCAVLLLDNQMVDPGLVIQNANKSLADFQRIRQWVVWPEPDFPRTPTQKPLLTRIREVAEAKLGMHAEVHSDSALSELVARITGRPLNTLSSNATLEGELNMSSLDRVELMSALEGRYQVDLSEARFSEAQTVAQLEQLLRSPSVKRAEHQVYPRWGQNWLVTWIRLAVYYLVVRPATYILAAPAIKGRENLRGLRGPVLVVSNHVTYIDIGWILAALSARFRHRLATAMDGERLAGMRHPPKEMNLWTRIIKRLSYFLAVALFNVFPLPKKFGFRRSFSFAGDLADRGWNILIFPEGITTPDGKLHSFQAGIGLLATQLSLPVVPIRLAGLFDLKQAERRIARPGRVSVTIGKPVRFASDQDPNEIARELQRRVAELESD
jgi:long-chain acyl-CoA synthetase